MTESCALQRSLVDLDEDAGLVVGEGGDCLSFLGEMVVLRAIRAVTASRAGERGNVEEEDIAEVLGLDTSEDGSLDGSTFGEGLVGVDGLVELIAVEEVCESCWTLGMGRVATNEDDFWMPTSLVAVSFAVGGESG